MDASEPPDESAMRSPGGAPPDEDPLDADLDAVARVTEVSRRRTLINSGANYVQYGISSLLALFLQGYAIRLLGKDQYALWPLVVTCTSIFLIVPLSISMAASRFLAHAFGAGRLDEVRRITTSVFVALLIVTLLYAGVVVLVSIFFESIFEIPPGAAGIGPWAMLLGGLAIAARIPFSIFRGGLQATQHFVAICIVEVTFLVLKAALILLAFTAFDPSLVWYGAALLIAECGTSLGIWVAARRCVPWQRIRRGSLDWKLLRKLGGFGFWLMVTLAAGRLFWETDNIIINKLIGPAVLTGYATVAVIILQCHGIVSLGAVVLFPSAAVLHARGDLRGIADMTYRANRVLVPLAVPLMAFLAIYGREVLTAYIGAEYAEYATVLAILAFPMAVSMTQTAAGSIPQACGRVVAPSVGSLIVAVVNVALSLYFVLVMDLGYAGVALGTAIVALPYRGIFWPWYVARLLGVPWLDHWVKAVLVPLAHSLPVGALMLGLRALGMGRSLTGLVVVFALAVSIQCVYILTWAMSKQDRRDAWALLARILRPPAGDRT